MPRSRGSCSAPPRQMTCAVSARSSPSSSGRSTSPCLGCADTSGPPAEAGAAAAPSSPALTFSQPAREPIVQRSFQGLPACARRQSAKPRGAGGPAERAFRCGLRRGALGRGPGELDEAGLCEQVGGVRDAVGVGRPVQHGLLDDELEGPPCHRVHVCLPGTLCLPYVRRQRGRHAGLPACTTEHAWTQPEGTL